MSECQGLVLRGLDEFMLRIGHLSVVSRLAYEEGQSWRRINRAATDLLSSWMLVGDPENSQVATYLFEKDLCPVADSTRSVKAPYRYPDLEIVDGPAGERVVRSTKPDVPVRVTWQDMNLSRSEIRSRVGAITTTARSGSKTGLSHIADWAQLLELLGSSAQLSPNARLMVVMPNVTTIPRSSWNPYLLGTESLFVAHEYILRDFDLFRYFARALCADRPPLSKSVCRHAFVEALRQAVHATTQSKSAPASKRFEISQEMRELERTARRTDKTVEETSTAWHRTASRVEMYVDLGFLEKGRKGEQEKYQYVYYPTDSLRAAIDTFDRCANAEDWISQYLGQALQLSTSNLLDLEEGHVALLRDIYDVVQRLKLPTSSFPIASLTLGVAYLRIERKERINLGDIRKQIEDLPQREPGIARLARGRAGTKAEFISLNIQKGGAQF